ncbi:MAG: hypothetical protein KAX78_02780, partial [Phycisphaerae bacterium]|nr:hypothetical protein [Phycisphaerae bacterium]
PENINYLGYNSGTYPDVPAAAMLGEFFTLVPPDDTRTDEQDDEWTRIYGRVNINTATREVLMQLPWPNRLPDNTEIEFAQVEDIVEHILAYRDRRATVDCAPNRDYTLRSDQILGAGITGLRRTTGSDIAGFLTPGEIAIPLADYYHGLKDWTDYNSTASDELDITQNKDYIRNRDSLYRAISNLITVNSDTYAVNIRVDLYDIGEAPGDEPAQSWYYVAVIDRSNCRSLGDTPAVLLFSEVK